ncbi:hypothetical protein Tco_1248863 [Tanacetum coccineum]
MPASDIPVPVYSSDESVGSSISLVILSNTETEMNVSPADIPAVIPEVAPEVEAAIVTSPTSVLDFTIYSDTKSDPPEDSSLSDHALVAPGVSLFLYDDHSKSQPLEDSSKEDKPEPHEATVARWRATVASRSSSSASTPPTSLQIVPTPPGLPRLPAVLVGQEIPFGRPYRTHPNGVRRMLTAKKRVHPIPARIPANCKRSRYVSSSSSPSPRKRRRVSPYSYSLATFSSSPMLRGSPSAFHQEVTIKDSIEVGYQASIEDGTETGYEASIDVTIEVTTEVTVEPDTPPILPEQAIAERLDGHKEVIQEMLKTTEAERTALRDRVRSLELSEPSLRDTLRIEREIFYSSASFGNEGDNENGNGGGNGNGHGNRNGGGKGNRNRGGNENGNDNNNIGMETTVIM